MYVSMDVCMRDISWYVDVTLLYAKARARASNELCLTHMHVSGPSHPSLFPPPSLLPYPPSLIPPPSSLIPLLPPLIPLPLPHRLPKNQDCHEMWCKQRRKKRDSSSKDAAGKGGGTTAPPTSGKTNNSEHQVSPKIARDREPQHPPTATQQLSVVNGPVTAQGHVTKLPHPNYNRSFSTGQVLASGVGVTSDVYPPLAHSQLPLRGVVRAGTPPLRASPKASSVQSQQCNSAYQLSNKAPAPSDLKSLPLSVPLPSAPLTANILESLAPEKILTNETRSRLGSGDGVKGVALPQSQHLQKVVDAQQLALLQEISDIVSKNKSLELAVAGSSVGQYQGVGPAATAASSAVGQGHKSESGSEALPATRIADRTQTFDYGNHSNKALEYRAAQQLEKDSYYRGKDNRWP